MKSALPAAFCSETAEKIYIECFIFSSYFRGFVAAWVIPGLNCIFCASEEATIFAIAGRGVLSRHLTSCLLGRPFFSAAHAFCIGFLVHQCIFVMLLIPLVLGGEALLTVSSVILPTLLSSAFTFLFRCKFRWSLRRRLHTASSFCPLPEMKNARRV